MTTNDGFGGAPPVSAPLTAATLQQAVIPAAAPAQPQPQLPVVPPAPVVQDDSVMGPAAAVSLADAKQYREFEIPESALGLLWSSSGFTNEDRKFGITEITTDQSQRAGRLMGAKMDITTAMREQQLMCLYAIGGKVIFRQRELKEKWLSAIGPGGVQCVEFCWNKVNTRPEAEMEGAYSTGELKGG